MNRVCRVAATVVLLVALPAIAQPPAPDPANLRGDSAQTGKRLDEAQKKLAAGQATEAIDALQRILDDAGDDLITLDGKQYRPARRFAHQILAKLPADALKSYQDRLEDPARKLLDAAKKTRDPGPLWQLLDRYYVSRSTEEGLLLLGDLLFQEGEFRGAEQIWRRLLPDSGTADAYPNPKTEPAAVQARLILASIFTLDTERAKAAIAAFKMKHPGASGQFAGKDGPYAETLQAFLDSRPTIPPTANRGTDWPTFGAGPDRVNRLGLRLPNYWPQGKPTWDARLQPVERHQKAPKNAPARPPFGHPVIVNGRVFVTDGTGIFGFDLLTGTPLKLPERFAPPLIWTDPLKPPPDASPSLTVAGDRLYLRIGPTLVRQPDPTKGKAEETAIVCLGPSTGAKDMGELWRLPPQSEGKPSIVWEGAPLISGRRMWAVHARFEGGRVIHGIDCYDPADTNTKPRGPVWSVDVSDSPLSTSGDPRARQELLTLAGRNVVFCSNAGAVVSLDAVSGRRAWGFRYPRARKADANRSPDPSPAVYACGRVFVAPADADRVYALDPESGQVLWESGPTEGASILGISAGKLIVTTTGPVRGLRALSIANGSYRDGDGWVLHNGGGLLSYGRGFVTDEVIVWPTWAGVLFVDPRTGELLRGPLLNHLGGDQRGFFGNMAYADGVLVVVTPTQVWMYLTEDKQFGSLRERTEADPARARFESLIVKAENAFADGDGKTGRAWLLAATGEEFPKALRAWAVARLLLLASRTDDEAKLPADLRVAIAPELRDEWLIPPNGIPTTLDTLILRHTGRDPAATFLPTSPALDAERKAEDAPWLATDAEVARTLKLPPGSVPLRWIRGMDNPPNRILVAAGEGLQGITLDEGDITRHDAADRFTHAAEIPQGFVAAGPLAVAVYAEGRVPVWVFRVPTTEPIPASVGGYRISDPNPPPVAELSSFQLTGSWLVARLGERHLIALDLKGKRVAWVLGTDGKLGFRSLAFPDAASFGPNFSATGRLIVAQLSDGRRWFIRAESGKVLDIPGFDHAGSRVWWTVPPVEVEPNRLAISDGPGLVRMLNLATGRVKWTHQEEREASLAGDPPQMRAWGGNIFIAIRRNHGVELDRLDMADGRSTWSGGAMFLDADSVNLAAADADAERIFVPVGNVLQAFLHKEGKPAWEAELPDIRGAGSWVVKAGRKCIVVYPECAIPREPVSDVWTRVSRSFRNDPQAWRLPGLLAGLYDAWVARSVPVLLFDAETGKRLSKIELPANGPAVTAWFERDLAVIATGEQVCWLK